jgi:hypothetical protein
MSKIRPLVVFLIVSGVLFVTHELAYIFTFGEIVYRTFNEWTHAVFLQSLWLVASLCSVSVVMMWRLRRSEWWTIFAAVLLLPVFHGAFSTTEVNLTRAEFHEMLWNQARGVLKDLIVATSVGGINSVIALLLIYFAPSKSASREC